MNKYKDVVESAVRVIESKSRKSGFLDDIEFPWGRSDVFNKNHRYYPHKTFKPAVEALGLRIGKANVPGQVDHPLGSGGTRLGDVSHILTKVWMDENKVAWARASILDTQKGRDTLKIIKSGVAIGASLRGYGEIDSSGKVKPGLEIKSVDLVCDPSFGADARVDQSSVIESYISEEEEELSEEHLEQITDALDELSDETVAMIQEKLKVDNVEMTPRRIKALALWIKMSKDNPHISPLHKWFKEWEAKFNPNLQQELNEELRHGASIKEEKRISGMSYGIDRKTIEVRQKEIDEALKGKTMSEKTISRFYAEYVLAGGKLSRANWIREFGF